MKGLEGIVELLKGKLLFEDGSIIADEKLAFVDGAFLRYVGGVEPNLLDAIKLARRDGEEFSPDILVEIAVHLEKFLIAFFSLSDECEKIKRRQGLNECIWRAKRFFVQRLALTALKSLGHGPERDDVVAALLAKKGKVIKDLEGMVGTIDEVSFCLECARVLSGDAGSDSEKAKGALLDFASLAIAAPKDFLPYSDWEVFRLPKAIDYNELDGFRAGGIVRLEGDDSAFVCAKPKSIDEAFVSTGSEVASAYVKSEAKYCIYCHKQSKDYCRKGMGDGVGGELRKNPLGLELGGCPLRQKISEMNMLKSADYLVAPLAVAMVDNPLLILTGRRICNDCAKSCIYQKQTPVDIPEIETSVLEDVLSVNYGFEVYYLLLRWNPLKGRGYLCKAATINGFEGKGLRERKVAVIGAGPAGILLSYYLLNAGLSVAIFDTLSVDDVDERFLKKAIKDCNFLFSKNEEKTSRVGGVMEYGITWRWNKNKLILAQIILKRYKDFSLFGGVFFDKTFSVDYCFDELKFDHIAVATGAGKNFLPGVKNQLCRGFYNSSEFLMRLYVEKIFLEEVGTKFVLKLPAIILGGGLTSVDCATECVNYYFRQLKKFARTNFATFGESTVGATNEDVSIFKKHWQEFCDSSAESSLLERVRLLRKWGGVHIVYRGNIKHSSSFVINDDELRKCLECGVEVVDNCVISELIVDEKNYINAVKVVHNGDEKNLLCKSFINAIGVDYYNYFSNEKLRNSIEEFNGKNKNNRARRSTISPVVYEHSDGRRISIFGDTNVMYNGSVVNALASAKDWWESVVKWCENVQEG